MSAEHAAMRADTARHLRDGTGCNTCAQNVLDLLDTLDTAERELDRLRQWKRETLSLFDGLQDLGRALDLPLGVLVTGPLAVEAATSLRAERDALLNGGTA